MAATVLNGNYYAIGNEVYEILFLINETTGTPLPQPAS